LTVNALLSCAQPVVVVEYQRDLDRTN
jgi:hypothetical protein